MNPYPYVLNNPLKYVDPLGLNHGRVLIMVNDGGGSSKSTPSPIVNTEPKKDVVKEIKKEVVKKETSGEPDWSCKIVNDGAIIRAMTSKEIAEMRMSKLINFIPVASSINDAKIAFTGNDVYGYIKTPGEVQDAKMGVFLDVSLSAIGGAVSRIVDNGVQYVNEASEVVEQISKKIKLDIQLFAKKGDIKQIEDVAKQFKMTSIQRKDFGDYVESLKDLVPNNKNFSYKELIDIVKEFLGVD